MKIKGYDSKVVEKTTKEIIDTAIRTGAVVSGPIPLPTQKKRWTVLRSPHVDSKSKEHFEMNIHKRLIEIVEHNSRTIDTLTHLQLAAGIQIEIK
ncbi:MAG: 30S ribosomal protein S10 [Candidatus Dojkabacteria bacterium]